MAPVNSNIQNLIESLTKEVLQEVLRGFKLTQFKNMSDQTERIKYADANLPKLGTGSSRTVYALGSNKVLKVAGGLWPRDEPELARAWPKTTQRGLAQNGQEVNLFTNPKIRPVVAKIYDFASDYSWLVAEAAQPLKNTDELTKYLGIPMYYVTDVLEIFKKGGSQITDSDLEEFVESFWPSTYARGEFSKLAGREIETEEDMQSYLKKVFIEHPIFSAVIHLVTELGHSPFDLNSPDHWGKTPDGRLVLLDYGFTDEVRDKY